MLYLNGGDWIENLTALEYRKGEWSLFSYEEAFGKESKKERKAAEVELMEAEQPKRGTEIIEKESLQVSLLTFTS